MPPTNPPPNPPLEVLDEICQLNALFLAFLRKLSDPELLRLGMTSAGAGVLRRAGADDIDRAARFPRALFRLELPPPDVVTVNEATLLSQDSHARVIALVLLHSARNLSRVSGYWARLLLRLKDEDVNRLRASEVDEIVSLSSIEDVVRVAANTGDLILPELLTESRPEYRRRLLLLGFQPELPSESGLAVA